jgi:methionyl aminopeptidase
MLSQTKSSQEIESMRKAGAILANGLEKMKLAVTPGVSTLKLAQVAENYLSNTEGKPAFLNYPGTGGAPPFPSVACVSVNDAVVHGVPHERTILKNGDIVSLDLGVSVDGMIVDGAITVAVGEVDRKKADLITNTKKALYQGLRELKDGCLTGNIGSAIEASLNQENYGIVRDLVGHGVGYSIHEDPNIPNFGKKGQGVKLKAGMTVAIEPMATLGSWKVYIDSDGWTVRTLDGSLAAHFEHTVLITDNGYEILTAYA